MKLAGSVILVTGGTGSFGNRVATKLFGEKPKEIRIYSRDEKKQWEMGLSHPDYRYIIGDVRDMDRLSQAMRGVDYVFHAAALKQVPSCETYPYEAVKTNIVGSYNACLAAQASGVKTFVALSNEYEMQRCTKPDEFLTIHPEHNVPQKFSKQSLGAEYSSENTRRIETPAELGALLDQMGVQRSLS